MHMSQASDLLGSHTIFNHAQIVRLLLQNALKILQTSAKLLGLFRVEFIRVGGALFT